MAANKSGRTTSKKGASKKSTKKKATRKATAKKSTKKAAAKKATKKGASKKSASRTSTKKTASKKTASKKTASKKTASKKVARTSAAKKTTARKSTKKATSKKRATKKTTSKKAAGDAASKSAAPKRATKKRVTSRATTTKKATRRPTGPKRILPPRNVSPAKASSALSSLPKSAFTPATGTETNKAFTKRELAKFDAMIHDLRARSAEELDELTEQLRQMAANEGADDNSYSLHMAEQGTDAMEREKTFLQAQRTSDYIKKLDEALARIEYETFGLCRVCGLRLDERRLKAVPVTQVCTVYKNTSRPCAPGKHYLDTFGEESE